MSVVTGPTHGIRTLNPDGSFSYQPGSACVGSDSFTYKATDGTDDSHVAAVTISVSAGCHGLAATIIGDGAVNGTSGADAIVTGGSCEAVVEVPWPTSRLRRLPMSGRRASRDRRSRRCNRRSRLAGRRAAATWMPRGG